uniref:Putative secreted protein n=1 Tax=Anopheles darlingi TaxID=43151 RepID=A0A2M4DJD5_ANODA
MATACGWMMMLNVSRGWQLCGTAGAKYPSTSWCFLMLGLRSINSARATTCLSRGSPRHWLHTPLVFSSFHREASVFSRSEVKCAPLIGAHGAS